MSVAREAFNLLDLCYPKVLQTTAPIFREDAFGRLESIGSAVLLALGDERIVLTAGHVLDDAIEKKALLVGSLDSLVRLHGVWFRTTAPKAAMRGEDRIDVAVVRLSKAARAKVHESCLLATDDLAPFLPLGHRGYALLAGYPCNKQVAGAPSKLEANLCTVMAQCCAPEDYARIGLAPAQAVLVGFHKKRAWQREGRSTAPKLVGMSGGGLWVFHQSSPERSLTPRLCGIIIEGHSGEWHWGATKLVVATRIELLLAAIWGQWPDLQSLLPQETSR